MKLAALFLFALRVSSLAIPESESESNRLTEGAVAVYSDPSNVGRSDSLESSHELAKRRGGGGGGHGGGGGGRGGSSGGSSGGRSGSSSSSGVSAPNSGGKTNGGSGRSPTYGGGGGAPYYYSGGAVVPYTSGNKKGKITPVLLGAGFAVALFGVSAWAFGAYAYDFDDHYTYRDPNTNKNVTLPVECICQRFAVCGCDSNNKDSYYKSVFNGTVPHNSSLVKIVDYKKEKTIFIDGSLPNGTTAKNAASSLEGGSFTTLFMTFIMVTGMVWFI